MAHSLPLLATITFSSFHLHCNDLCPVKSSFQTLCFPIITDFFLAEQAQTALELPDREGPHRVKGPHMVHNGSERPYM